MKNYGWFSLQLKRDGDGIMELSSKVRSGSWRTLSLEYQQSLEQRTSELEIVAAPRHEVPSRFGDQQ